VTAVLSKCLGREGVWRRRKKAKYAKETRKKSVIEKNRESGEGEKK